MPVSVRCAARGNDHTDRKRFSVWPVRRCNASVIRVNQVTTLLRAIAAGDKEAGERLIPLVYQELRQMAARRMAGNLAGQTLQPTALVHEAWLRMGGENPRGWENRAHFFAAAATAMRSVLVDRARRRKAMRHGGGQQRVNMDDVEIANQVVNDDQILAVHEALEKLAVEEPQKAELVKLRYFAGLSVEETAETLGISEPTAKRWWAYARGWLGREIKL
jgi:RNA polymerase sigma factor (TIGR02999 family)